MSKELLEILDKINDKKAEVKKLAEENKLEEAKKAKEELKELQAKFDLLKDLEDGETGALEDKQKNGEIKKAEDKDPVKEFADAARKKFKVENVMKEGAPEEGGYTVPEDIQTKINKRRESKASLIDLVSVELVTTNKGARTFKKREQQTGFQKVGESGKIGGKATPKFERIEYEIAKYAGYFPVTNELLADSDAAITNMLTEWIGDESRVTRNNIIKATIDKKAKTALKSLDDIKKALNVTLGAAFKSTSKIVTNDDGLQYLDTLKDNDGKYLLQPNPADPMKLRLCAGATIIPVEIIPNEDLPSDTKTAKQRKIPMIIGDLKEGIKFFDREKLTIVASDLAVAGELNAFEEDLTLFRAIEREDCQIRDEKAFVNGELAIADETVTGS